MEYKEIIENEELVDIELRKEKGRAERRKKDFSKAARKKTISEQIVSPSVEKDGTVQKGGMYQNLHQYSKGRVKCGCFLCTGRKGGRHKPKRYLSSKGMYSYSHGKKLDASEDQMKEFEFAV